MSRRRACLVVPAAPAAKLAKGATLAADEVVLDLEDAVVPGRQGRGARGGGGGARRRVGGGVGGRARELDRHAVVPRRLGCAGGERARGGDGGAPEGRAPARPRLRRPAARGRRGRGGPHDAGAADRADRDRGGPGGGGRDRPRLGAARRRSCSATPTSPPRSGGRRPARRRPGASPRRACSWPRAPRASRRSTARTSARATTTRSGRARRTRGRSATTASGRSTRPSSTPCATTFTPTEEEVADAREVLAALERAAADGAGAVAADGQMLDEAPRRVSARRARAGARRRRPPERR